jgi:hypothetical protein
MCRRLVSLLLAVLSACGGEDEPPAGTPPVAVKPAAGLSFAMVDVAAEMGYTLRNRSGTDTEKNFILEAMPPGIAVADYDGDGWMDLYCPNGNVITRYHPESNRVDLISGDEAPRNELYWNRGGKRFEPGGQAAGVADTSWSFGAVAGDIDNDGDADIYCCNFGLNRLYLNDGKGAFTEVAVAAGAAGDARAWSTGACFVDYDRDGDLDIYVAQFADMFTIFPDRKLVKMRPDGSLYGRTCDWRGLKVYCGPTGIKPENDLLLENKLAETGELRFEDVTKARGIWFDYNELSATGNSKGPFYGFQPVAWDIDGDGWQDIFVANDSVANLCWMNREGKRFEDEALLMGLALSMSDRTPQASMGVGVGDINNDGQFDVIVSEFSHDQFNLLLAEKVAHGRVVFNEKATRTGMRHMTFHKLGWGSNLVDFDLDGDLDIFFACGHVYPEVDLEIFKDQQTPYRQYNLLILNEDPRRLKLEDVSKKAGPGLQVKKASRATAAVDFDNDGDADIATTELNDRPTLLRCDVDRGRAPANWLQVALRGDPAAKVSRDAAGAVVTVHAGDLSLMRIRLIGSSFQSSEDPRLLFGLGGAERVDRIEVLWPNGKTTTRTDVAVNQLVTIAYSDS